MNRSTRTAAALSVLVLIAAACGSDDDSSAETTADTATEAAAAAPVDTDAATTDATPRSRSAHKPTRRRANPNRPTPNRPTPDRPTLARSIRVRSTPSRWATPPGRAGSRSPSPSRRASSRRSASTSTCATSPTTSPRIDAMAAGELDGVTQTLNDTMASVAAGSEQVIVVVNDNSTGNDKIICDDSINTIEDMAGKTVAAEAGVVDHFLLVQGLRVGRPHRGRHRLPWRAHRRRGGRVRRPASSTASACSPRSGSRRSSGTGSHELFSSADFPGLIPDHIVVSRELVDEQPGGGPEAGRRLVPDARLHRGEPRRGDRDHGRGRRDLGRGVRARSPRAPRSSRAEEALAAFAARRRHDVAPLHRRADQPVPRRRRASPRRRRRSTACSTPASPRTGSTGWATERHRQDVDSTPTMTGHVVATRFGMLYRRRSTRTGGARPDARAGRPGSRRRPARRRPAGAGASRRSWPPAGRHPRSAAPRVLVGAGSASPASSGCGRSPSTVLVAEGFPVPTIAATWDALIEMWRDGELWPDFVASTERVADRLLDQPR